MSAPQLRGCGMGTIAHPIHQEVTGQRRFGETSGFILLKSIFFLFGPPHQTPAMPTGCWEGWGRSRLQPPPHPSPQPRRVTGQHVEPSSVSSTSQELLLVETSSILNTSQTKSHGESPERARDCAGCSCVGPIRPAVARPRGM